MQHKKITPHSLTILFCGLILLVITSCSASTRPSYLIAELPEQDLLNVTSTPYPTRPVYEPGTLVSYIAQTGDTLEALAVRFNTTIAEIREANPIIPDDATTMPPGFPMEIPIYYEPLWGPDYQIIPDSLFINGPQQLSFDLRSFLNNTNGWLNDYKAYASETNMDAIEMIDWVAYNYSISPKLLLALVEFQTNALTSNNRDLQDEEVFLGFETQTNRSVYLQISYVANMLNDFYYSYRLGKLTSFEHLDGRIENTDPWQNAATVALHVYFSKLLDGEAYLWATGPDGFAKTYKDLFGDPWENVEGHIPGSLTQPPMQLPFESGKTWAYTGGPHTGWGSLNPWSAIDFAPPTSIGGCAVSEEYATAVADGVIARTANGIVVLDLDGDGDERTGWVVFYLHVAEKDMIAPGTFVKAGDPIGHPSCEGGRSTGTHIHVARKFNGEWIPADGLIPFSLSGWQARSGLEAYQGYLEREGKFIIANSNPNNASFITAD